MFSIPSFNLHRIACCTCLNLSPSSPTAAPRPQHRTSCSFQHSSGIVAPATSHPGCEVQISPVSSAPTDARKLRAPSSLRRIRSTCTFRSQHYPEKNSGGGWGVAPKSALTPPFDIAPVLAPPGQDSPLISTILQKQSRFRDTACCTSVPDSS